MPSSDSLVLPQGMRATPATRAVLGLWQGDADALRSEAEVEEALRAQGVRVNRVTVYRLLDRLARAGLLRRCVDASRVARYALAAQETGSGAAARFECADCHHAFRLGAQGDASGQPLQDALRQLWQALAASGLQGQAIDVAVTGLCRDCQGAAATP